MLRERASGVRYTLVAAHLAFRHTATLTCLTIQHDALSLPHGKLRAFLMANRPYALPASLLSNT